MPKQHQSNARDYFRIDVHVRVCIPCIGHAIARKIRNDQNGIWYENPHLGKGSNIVY
jgi:hypothetical protein